MATNALECNVCCHAYSEDNCPRILPCSHTFCGPCIDRIIAAQGKTCPSCRVEFTATSAEDLMICRTALDVVKQLASIDVKPKTLSSGPKGSFLGFTKEFEEKSNKDSTAEFREAENKHLKEMKDVLADIENLSKAKDTFIDTNKGIEGFMEELQEIKLSNENHLDIIDQKIKWVKKRLSLLLQEEGKTQDADAKLETATDFTSSGPVMDETEDGQEKVKRIKEELQEEERKRDDMTMEIVKMKRRLKIVAEDMEKVARFAVKVIEGKQMVALVKVKPTKQICWSLLGREILPECLSIKHEALMTSSSRRAFLDLAVGGAFLSRLIIKVMDEGNLALNFLHMCAGDLGPSYANSQLSREDRNAKAGEWINVCTNLKSVMEVDWDKEKQREIYKSTPLKVGEVRGYLSDANASKFSIVTVESPNLVNNSSFSLRHRNLKLIDNNCFGIVEEGLDALRDAISQYPDISAVRIVDCGLMISVQPSQR